jgi:hypothetical protein
MSKQFSKLEETLELPNIDDVIDSSMSADADVMQALQNAQNLEDQFKNINGYDQHDREMDELADLAIQAHKDLQELGMNVEVKHAGEIFSSSSQMLKIAVDAKYNKVDKKLKLLKLQLDKLRIDKMSKSDDTTTLDGTAVMLDRNELLKQLREISDGDK